MVLTMSLYGFHITDIGTSTLVNDTNDVIVHIEYISMVQYSCLPVYCQIYYTNYKVVTHTGDNSTKKFLRLYKYMLPIHCHFPTI